MRTIIITLLLQLALLSVGKVQAQNLTIKVANIESSDGQLIISFYKNEKQFPEHPFKTLNIEKKNTLTSTIKTTLPEGKYAIVVLDDCNQNNEMDYRFTVIPKEAIGFSNNVKIEGLKSPSFDRCAFHIDYIDPKLIEIDLIRF